MECYSLDSFQALNLLKKKSILYYNNLTECIFGRVGVKKVIIYFKLWIFSIEYKFYVLNYLTDASRF